MMTATRLRVRVQKSISVLRVRTEKFSITTLRAESDGLRPVDV